MAADENEGQPTIFDRRSSSNEGDAGLKEEMTQSEQDEKPLQEQLTEEREKAQAYLASWQRAAADFQNYKRRIEQEREETAKFANTALLLNLLPLIDDLERALQNLDPRLHGMTWIDGIYLIQRKFQALLEINGVEEVPAIGETFDPNVHEAVMFGQGEEGKVIGVVQKGYKLGGRVLRPAMVVVGQGGQPKADGTAGPE